MHVDISMALKEVSVMACLFPFSFFLIFVPLMRTYIICYYNKKLMYVDCSVCIYPMRLFIFGHCHTAFLVPQSDMSWLVFGEFRNAVYMNFVLVSLIIWQCRAVPDASISAVWWFCGCLILKCLLVRKEFGVGFFEPQLLWWLILVSYLLLPLIMALF